MPNYNAVTIIGHLTRAPELQSGKSGKKFCKGGIAYNDFQKKAHFFNFVAFEKTADLICGHFEKGDAVGLVGELSQNTWTDKDGGKRSDVEIVVRSVIFLGQKPERSEPPPPRRNASRPTSAPTSEEYDDYATSLPEEPPF